MPPKTREERIDDALSRLVDGANIYLADESEDESDRRYVAALQRARQIVQSSASPSILPDINHVSDAIKQNLREGGASSKALEFGNLLERLLAQPVLSQKWAILYLLHQLSPPSRPRPAPVIKQPARNSIQQSPTERGGVQLPTERNVGLSPAERKTFDDAFSRAGLPVLPHSNRSPDRINLPQQVPARQTQYQPKDVHVNGHREQHHEDETPHALSEHTPSEAQLLRDLPFVLQGVSTTHMVFTSNNSLKLSTKLPPSIISLLHALAEPALLYKKLANFIDSPDQGLFGQSLRAAVGVETRSYLGLVATLEGQIRRVLSEADASSNTSGLGKAGVTLKRCVIWTREATLGLRFMCLIVEEAESRRGGQVISLIHSFASSHGDPFINSFAERLLTHVTKPFYDMLRSWIYDGELRDPCNEFLVSEHMGPAEDEGAKGGATSVWEDKYKLEADMIPSIITTEFARKVFLIGKSLNFIRHGCGDSAWVESYSKSTSRELHYGDTATLESSIDAAYKTTMARLTDLMNNKFHLMEHLSALKKYLLLGQGDFTALLMESLASNLDRPANSQYRHTLTAQLEHAIRNSNAQYESAEVLRRLDARMLELSHGEIGWDVFTLEYKVDAPVDVIVTPYASKQYLKVFNFLWRIKRVGFALSTTWRRHITGARGILGNVADKLGRDWKTARCMIAEMVHFVDQLQYYILFEVIEKSWAELSRAMSQQECTLDDLIQAHAKYLKSITRKGLLGSSSLEFTAQLHELLKIMLSYKDAVDGLYSYSLTEFTRRQERSARIEMRTAQGRWGITEQDEDDDLEYDRSRNKKLPHSRDADSPAPAPLISMNGKGGVQSADSGVLDELRQNMRNLATDFHTRVSGLISDLAYQPDTDMRFLGVVMNFNDAYKIERRSRPKNDPRKQDRARGGSDKQPHAPRSTTGTTRSK